MFKTFLLMSACAGINLAVGNVLLGGLFVLAQMSTGIACFLDLATEMARDEK
jgi:hypothetical protein